MIMKMMDKEPGSPEKVQPDDEGRETNSLDKITLNNTIVKMRPLVVQAKVHCIHHLSAAIKAGEKRKFSGEFFRGWGSEYFRNL
jgi:hypothetical protein